MQSLSMASQPGEGRIPVVLVSANETFVRAATDLLGRHPDVILVGALPLGKQAMARALRPEVVLVDLDLPHQAGLAIIRGLREAMPEVATVALTGLQGGAYRRAALAAGSDESVSKARLTTELLPAIRGLAGPRS